MKKIIAGIIAFAMLFGTAYADNNNISEIANNISVNAETLTLDNGLVYEVSGIRNEITIRSCNSNSW